ncbi:Shikimate 5-dehydrogenase I alpha [Caballeronia glathei]|jgi:shikimate dehydrogenase|uniref:Shikimate dehydrogenase n=1 Tax=Caballeronia glathei TaxID=60547 RepID=A0A069PUV4_9BURK|nr:MULTISPECIES: ThiF family adenylyltransferase [Burkholderiaceae]KDR44207.1 shikimate dehydrogenase [Caballeronia glathei]TCK34642.1 shikimate dehydrogenase [Paraburkholderia sp. BL8N3]CDY77486.1 Shikimate 5-dehydrogenase I alpha [Caballeronia glathei]
MNQGTSFSASLDAGLSGATRLYFIVGDPIAQVRSPAGVTAALRAAGRDAIVVPAHVASENLPAFFAGASQMKNVDGIIVTVPHKFSATEYCASLTDEAAFLGTVNTLRRLPDGRWHGGMFDGTGFVSALLDAGGKLADQRVLLIGAGGAGSAIGHALLGAGVASLDVRDNDRARTQSLVERLNGLKRGAVSAARESDGPETFDVIVNASPAGMRSDDPLPFDVTRLPGSTFVGDVVTKPPLTPMIEAARSRGCGTVTGTQMFGRVRDRIVEFLLEV